jgi:hypothetical protein
MPSRALSSTSVREWDVASERLCGCVLLLHYCSVMLLLHFFCCCSSVLLLFHVCDAVTLRFACIACLALLYDAVLNCALPAVQIVMLSCSAGGIQVLWGLRDRQLLPACAVQPLSLHSTMHAIGCAAADCSIECHVCRYLPSITLSWRCMEISER